MPSEHFQQQYKEHLTAVQRTTKMEYADDIYVDHFLKEAHRPPPLHSKM